MSGYSKYQISKILVDSASYALNAGSGSSSGSTSPGGSNSQIQYNNSGSFGGLSILTYNGSQIIATNINATGSFSGSFNGNISNAVSSSYALTASFALNSGPSISSSYASTSSLSQTSSYSLSSSYSTTSSYSLNSRAGGSNIQVQYNKSNILTGSKNLIFDDNLNILLISGSFKSGYLNETYSSASHAEGYSNYAGVNAYEAESIISGNFTLKSSYGNISSDYPISSQLYFNDLSFDAFYLTKVFIIASSSFSGTNTQLQITDTTINGTGAYVFNLDNSTTWNGDVITGFYSHAEGINTRAIGNYSHAEGENSEAVGNSSHAEGFGSTSEGIYSHAEGVGTHPKGEGSHTEGTNTTAIGNYSHAEGVNTVSYGDYSHAEGNGTISSGSYQKSIGWYNTLNNTSSILIIGNGINNSSRSDLALFNSESILFNKPLTASLFGTASYALNTSPTISSSYALTSSYALNSSFSISSSYSETASISVSSSYLINNPTPPYDISYYKITGSSQDRWYGNNLTGFAFSTSTLTIGRISYIPIVISKNIIINRIAITITAGATGSARLGIYNSNNCFPSTLLGDYGTVVTTNPSTNLSISISQSLNAGLYFVAIVSDATPTLRAVPTTAVANFFGTTNNLSTGIASFITSASSFSALTSDASGGSFTLQTAVIPYVAYRIS